MPRQLAKWAMVAMVLAVGSGGMIAQDVFDPTTIVRQDQVAEWKKEFKPTKFSLLRSFDYPEQLPPDHPNFAKNKPVLPANVQALQGTKVAVPGYMIPLDFDSKGVKTFIVVPFVDWCHYGVSGMPNEWILVKMSKKTKYTDFSPITVFGKLDMGEVYNKGVFESFYRLEGTAISVDGVTY